MAICSLQIYQYFIITCAINLIFFVIIFISASKKFRRHFLKQRISEMYYIFPVEIKNREIIILRRSKNKKCLSKCSMLSKI